VAGAGEGGGGLSSCSVGGGGEGTSCICASVKSVRVDLYSLFRTSGHDGPIVQRP